MPDEVDPKLSELELARLDGDEFRLSELEELLFNDGELGLSELEDEEVLFEGGFGILLLELVAMRTS